MSWECACGIVNKDSRSNCGGCGWTKEQLKTYKSTPAGSATEDKVEKKIGFFRSIFDWRIGDEELKMQIGEYDSLSLTKSYRKLSALIFAGCSILTVSHFYITDGHLFNIIFYSLIFTVLVTLMYYGNIFGICLTMGFWTYAKGLDAYNVLTTHEGNLVYQLLWWAMLMSYFWKAFRVENTRRKMSKLSKIAI